MTQLWSTVPDLKEMATFSIAIALWNHIDMPYVIWRRHKDSDEWRSLRLEVPKLAKSLSLPNSENRFVVQYVNKVLSEIESWVSYHYRTIFFKHGPSYDLFCHLSKFVWYSNGTINYKKTALNLQSSFRLNDLEKFRFLCVYCLVDEIEQKWPSMFENQVFDCAEFNEYPLINYWNCYCKNKLHEIPVFEGLTIDSTMFRHSGVDNWSAKEYFFDCMRAEEQIQNTVWLIDELNDVYFQKLILQKLTNIQRDQIYVNCAVDIIANYCTNKDFFNDILSTWFDLKDLINELQFVSIIRILFYKNVDDSIVGEIWISASDKFKLHALNANNEELERKIWDCWKRAHEHDSFVMLINASVSVRSEIRSKTIFYKHCVRLMCDKKLPILERVLNLCFPKDKELAEFKLSLTEDDCFVGQCRRFINDNDLSTLERLLNLCFSDVDSLARFSEHFTAEEFFVQHCFKLMSQPSILERLLIACIPSNENLVRFKQNFVTKKSFEWICHHYVLKNSLLLLQQLLNLFFTETEQFVQLKQNLFIGRCNYFIIQDKISTLETLFNYFFVDVEESTRFKLRIANSSVFSAHCINLIIDDKLPTLEVLLNLMFTGAEALTQFKHNLASLKCVNERCSRYYATANSKGVNDLLELLLSPRDDLIIKYKQQFLLSEVGFKACIALCNKSEDVLNKTISDCLPGATRDSTNEFKKKITFSPATIAEVGRMIRCNRLNDVKNCVDMMLANDEDTRTLKMLMIENANELIATIFSNKYDESTRQSLMSWLLPDEELVRKCKSQISIDKVFRDAFKDCIFQTYDQNGRFSHCTLKKKFEFNNLHGILKWYFVSPKKIKEYKIRMMDKYEDLEAIGTLLKKGCHFSYWKDLVEWVFENDSVKVAKFKKKHAGEKIADMVKSVRVNFSRRNNSSDITIL